MICNKCGATVPDVSRYCMFCGSPVSKVNYYNDNNDDNNDNRDRTYYSDFDYDFGMDEPKSKKTAGLLGIFLGGFGVHRFYLGYTMMGVLQIVVSVLTCGLGGSIWGFIEGLCILCDRAITTDANGRPLE